VTPDTVLIVIVLAVAATVQIAGLVYIANQNRKMNDKTIADDARQSTFRAAKFNKSCARCATCCATSPDCLWVFP
jgi:hypothetical protein